MQIYVYDSSLVMVGVLETFDTFIWTERYDTFGDFELYTSPSIENISLLQEDNILKIKNSPKSMIIESIQMDSKESGDNLVIKGRSLESILERRRVTNQTIFTSANMQTAILQLIDDAFISSSYLKRNISNFITSTSTDSDVTTPTLSAQYRLDMINEIVEKLCKKHNLGFKIELNTSNQFVFSLYAGKDRSRGQTDYPLVLFSSKLDNLIDSSFFRSSKNKKNDTLVIAQLAPDEEKWAPVWLVIPDYPDEEGGLGKREMSSDGSSVDRYDNDTNLLIPWGTYSVQLEEIGLKDLNDRKETIIFQGTADASMGFKYREDFFLGDIVQFEDKFGNSGKARVKEIIITEETKGTSVFPILEQEE